MNKVLISVAILVLVVLGFMAIRKPTGRAGGAGPFSYQTSGVTQATSSVGVYSWSSILSADSTKGYAAICNNSVISNEAIFLGFGATTTKPFGYRLASGNCYEMDSNKLFYGTIYAIASSSTTTVLTVQARTY